MPPQPAKREEWRTVGSLVQPNPGPQLSSCEAAVAKGSRRWPEQKGKAEANPAGDGFALQAVMGRRRIADGTHPELRETVDPSLSMQQSPTADPAAPGGGAHMCVSGICSSAHCNNLQAESNSMVVTNKALGITCPGLFLFRLCHL